jgi:hypothetical protein
VRGCSATVATRHDPPCARKLKFRPSVLPASFAAVAFSSSHAKLTTRRRMRRSAGAASSQHARRSRSQTTAVVPLAPSKQNDISDGDASGNTSAAMLCSSANVNASSDFTRARRSCVRPPRYAQSLIVALMKVKKIEQRLSVFRLRAVPPPRASRWRHLPLRRGKVSALVTQRVGLRVTRESVRPRGAHATLLVNARPWRKPDRRARCKRPWLGRGKQQHALPRSFAQLQSRACFRCGAPRRTAAERCQCRVDIVAELASAKSLPCSAPSSPTQAGNQKLAPSNHSIV